MTILANLVAVPTSGTVVVFSGQAQNASQVSVRNTGTVNVLLGQTGSLVFPLMVGEFIGLVVDPTDTLLAAIQSGSTQGQLAILANG